MHGKYRKFICTEYIESLFAWNKFKVYFGGTNRKFTESSVTEARNCAKLKFYLHRIKFNFAAVRNCYQRNIGIGGSFQRSKAENWFGLSRTAPVGVEEPPQIGIEKTVPVLPSLDPSLIFPFLILLFLLYCLGQRRSEMPKRRKLGVKRPL